ncbi:hypothetical protein D3C87_1849290 [compost metagenome]
MARSCGEGERSDSPLAVFLAENFALTRTVDTAVDNSWLQCEGFRVTRKNDHVTLDKPHAG